MVRASKEANIMYCAGKENVAANNLSHNNPLEEVPAEG